jgi:hypothetical protein
MTSTSASVGGGLEAGDCPRQPLDFSIFPVDRVVEEEFNLTDLDGSWSPI